MDACNNYAHFPKISELQIQRKQRSSNKSMFNSEDLDRIYKPQFSQGPRLMLG